MNNLKIDPAVANMLTQVDIDAKTINIMLTRELAEFLLAHNEGNRKIKVGKLNSVISDIREDRWRFNGDTIKVSTTGRLIDGQTRLTAFVEAGCPRGIMSALCVMSPEFAAEAYERQNASSPNLFVNQLEMMGCPSPRFVGPIVTSIGRHMVSFGGNRGNLSICEQMRLKAEYLNTILKFNDPDGKSAYRMMRDGFAAVVYLAHVLNRVDDAKGFLARLLNCTPIPNTPEQAYYKWLMVPQISERKVRRTRQECWSAAGKAFLYGITGRSLAKIIADTKGAFKKELAEFCKANNINMRPSGVRCKNPDGKGE